MVANGWTEKIEEMEKENKELKKQLKIYQKKDWEEIDNDEEEMTEAEKQSILGDKQYQAFKEDDN